METAEAMLVFNKYDEMVELIQRLASKCNSYNTGIATGY